MALSFHQRSKQEMSAKIIIANEKEFVNTYEKKNILFRRSCNKKRTLGENGYSMGENK